MTIAHRFTRQDQEIIRNLPLYLRAMRCWDHFQIRHLLEVALSKKLEGIFAIYGFRSVDHETEDNVRDSDGRQDIMEQSEAEQAEGGEVFRLRSAECECCYTKQLVFDDLSTSVPFSLHCSSDDRCGPDGSSPGSDLIVIDLCFTKLSKKFSSYPKAKERLESSGINRTLGGDKWEQYTNGKHLMRFDSSWGWRSRSGQITWIPNVQSRHRRYSPSDVSINIEVNGIDLILGQLRDWIRSMNGVDA
jgi:hypothetical protein